MILPRRFAACFAFAILLFAPTTFAQPPEGAQPAGVSFDAIKLLMQVRMEIVKDSSLPSSKRLRALSNIGELIKVYDDVGGDVKDIEDLRIDTILWVLEYLAPSTDDNPSLAYAAADVVHALRKHAIPLLVKSMGPQAVANVDSGNWELTIDSRVYSFGDIIVIRRLVTAMRDYAKEENTENADRAELFKRIIDLSRTIVLSQTTSPPTTLRYPRLVRGDAFDVLQSMTLTGRGAKPISDEATLLALYDALRSIVTGMASGGDFRLAAAQALAKDLVTKGIAESTSKSLISTLIDLAETSTDHFVRQEAAAGLDSLVKDDKVLLPEGKRDEFINGLFTLIANNHAPVRLKAAATIGKVAKSELSDAERTELKDSLLGALNGLQYDDVRPSLLAAIQSLAVESHLATIKAELKIAQAKLDASKAAAIVALAAETAATTAKAKAQDASTQAAAKAALPGATDADKMAAAAAKLKLDEETAKETSAKKARTDADKAQADAEKEVKAATQKLEDAQAKLGVVLSQPATPSGSVNDSQGKSRIFFVSTDVKRASQTAIFASSRVRASQIAMARAFATSEPTALVEGLRRHRVDSETTPTLPENQKPGLRRFADLAVEDFPQNQQAGLRVFRKASDMMGLPDITIADVREIRFGPPTRAGAVLAPGAPAAGGATRVP